ncbi:MAG: hypothetical protein DLM73_05110 [Chthoniobacterales bacterium]|nr:MAG: hypothetical protein DLM73_05110 [Chthoniobacterales bacterium]
MRNQPLKSTLHTSLQRRAIRNRLHGSTGPGRARRLRLPAKLLCASHSPSVLTAGTRFALGKVFCSCHRNFFGPQEGRASRARHKRSRQKQRYAFAQ